MNERFPLRSKPARQSVVLYHWGAIAVGALFLLLSLYYNVSIPSWESDNEWAHFNYARFLLTSRSLPTPDTVISVPATGDQCRSYEPTHLKSDDQLLRQPPFYYMLGALALSGAKTDDQFAFDINPYTLTDPARAGYNIALHTPAENFPYRGTIAAMHSLRLLSGLLGLIGLIATYLAGLLVFGGRRFLATAAMAVNAFIPQYVFSSAVANNDILVGVLGSWCIYLCLRIVLGDGGLWNLALAALLAGLAIVTKYDGVIILPIVAATALFKLVQTWQTSRSQFGKTCLQIGAIAIVGALPAILWFGRNKLLFGSFLVGYGALGSRLNPLNWSDLRLLRAAEFTFMTFWGLFGVDNIALPPAVLVILAIPTLLAMAGVVVFLFDKRQPARLRALVLSGLLFILIAWGVVVLRAIRNPEPRGRYLLPIYSLVSLLTILGLYRLMPTSLKKPVCVGLAAMLLALSVAVPPLVLEPLYARPILETSAALRAEEEPLHAVFGDFAELVGYRVEPHRLGLYEKATVTLVWRALRETPNNYSIGVHLLDSANRSHGSVVTYPHHGTFATSYWQTGDVFRDSYEIYLDPSATPYLPTLGKIKVAMYCHTPTDDQYLDVKDQQGTVIGDAVYFDRLKLASSEDTSQQRVAVESLAHFGDELALENYTITPGEPKPGQEVSMELTWRALKPPSADYTLFAHIVDDRGNLIASSDQPLTDGTYPSDLWEAGEQVTHLHHLVVPPDLANGRYQILVGLYRPDTGVRIPVVLAGGAPADPSVPVSVVPPDQLAIGSLLIDN